MSLELRSATAGFTVLGGVDPTKLSDARLSLHWAAQIAAAAGATVAEARPDYSHTSLEWLSDLGAFAGADIGDGKRAALLPASFEIAVVSGSSLDARTSLNGRTLDASLGWLADQLGTGRLSRPEHDLPSHPVEEGARFEIGDVTELAELGRWFDAADRLVRAVAAPEKHASPTRCWPHHFDLAALIALDPDEADAEKARSIGFGLSPGDGSYDEPYLYVTPWPYPSDGELPELRGGGSWHTEGFTAAVLTASTIVEDSVRRGESVAEFAASALAGCRAILGSTPS